MPAEQRGSVYGTKKGYGIRWLEDGRRRHQSGFKSKTEARNWWDDQVRPRLLGLAVTPPDKTLNEFIPEYLATHAVGREASTIWVLETRLRYAQRTFGHVTLKELERRTAQIADWTTTLPEGTRHGIVQAFRQTLDTACRWGLMSQNPAKLAGKNPQPKRAEVVPFTVANIDQLASELGPYGPVVIFASETGLRPCEWIPLEARDIDRAAGVVVVSRSFFRKRLKEYGKTERSRRRVPLSSRAVQALTDTPRRLDTTLLFPSPTGARLDLHNWRAREWAPAVEAAGLGKGRRIYDLRHTFATNALAAGLSIFELSRIMGTSATMIDLTYGHLAKGSEDTMRSKLDAFATDENEASENRFGLDLVSD